MKQLRKRDVLEYRILNAGGNFDLPYAVPQGMSTRPDLYNPLLHAIATALDVPVTAFLSDPLGDEGGDVITLLRAWAAIGDAQGQRRVLNAALREADRSLEGSGLTAENVTSLTSNPD